MNNNIPYLKWKLQAAIAATRENLNFILNIIETMPITVDMTSVEMAELTSLQNKILSLEEKLIQTLKD